MYCLIVHNINRSGCVTTQMYWLGPLLGGLLAGLLYDLVFAANASVDKAKVFFTRRDYDDSQFGKPQQFSAKVEMTESTPALRATRWSRAAATDFVVVTGTVFPHHSPTSSLKIPPYPHLNKKVSVLSLVCPSPLSDLTISSPNHYYCIVLIIVLYYCVLLFYYCILFSPLFSLMATIF